LAIVVRQATTADLDALVPLFDAYRVFYRKTSDPELARTFLSERLSRNQSVVFLAMREDGAAVGFTQLYPSFSSAAAAPVFILNDLFVAPDARRNGRGSVKRWFFYPCDRRASPLFSTLVQFIKSVPKSQSERPGWSHPVQSGESPEAPLSRGRKQAAASGVG